MLFPVALLVPIAASVAVYFLFTGIDAGRHYWIAAAKAAAAVAGLRIALVSAGVYLLENTSGWLQLPAYFMALCGLPEMILLPRPSWGKAGTMILLSALMVAGTAAWIFALAVLAARGKRQRSKAST